MENFLILFNRQYEAGNDESKKISSKKKDKDESLSDVSELDSEEETSNEKQENGSHRLSNFILDDDDKTKEVLAAEETEQLDFEADGQWKDVKDDAEPESKNDSIEKEKEKEDIIDNHKDKSKEKV